LGGPLLLEDGEIHLVAPGSLEPLVADQVRFPAHPETFREPQRRIIASVDPSNDAMKPELIKGEMQQLMRGFGRVTTTGVRGIKHPPNLTAAVLDAPQGEHDVTNEPPRRG
jgi:hypothetical protein